jgi:hypothetical protein
LTSILGNFIPFKSITKGQKTSTKTLYNSILAKIVDIFPNYLNDYINYYSFLTTVIKYTTNGKVNEMMKPLSTKSISGYKSHMLSFLSWYQRSFPELKDNQSPTILLPLLYTNFATTQIFPFFEKSFINGKFEPKTIMNIYIALKRLLVMVLDMQFLKTMGMDDIIGLTHKKHKDFCYWMKTTVGHISLRISHYGNEATKKQVVSVSRETLEKKNRWIDFNIVIAGWKKGKNEIAKMIIDKSQENEIELSDLFKLNCFLAFTLVTKIPTGRSQNLKLMVKKSKRM